MPGRRAKALPDLGHQRTGCHGVAAGEPASTSVKISQFHWGGGKPRDCAQRSREAAGPRTPLPASAVHLPPLASGRLIQTFLYRRSSPDDNQYSKPLDAVPLVDLNQVGGHLYRTRPARVAKPSGCSLQAAQSLTARGASRLAGRNSREVLMI